MSHYFEKHHIHLPRNSDRRVRLSGVDRNDIRTRHKNGDTIRAIARAYAGACSRRLIQFVIFPEREEKVRMQYKKRGQAKKTYERVRGAKWASIMREHRAYKMRALSNQNNHDNIKGKNQVGNRKGNTSTC